MIAVFWWYEHTAISRKVVGKSARDNHERYYGWFWVRFSSKKFERMAPEAVDVCLGVLKESTKGSFDSYSVRNSVLIIMISHITFPNYRVHIFADNLSRNSCIQICAWLFAPWELAQKKSVAKWPVTVRKYQVWYVWEYGKCPCRAVRLNFPNSASIFTSLNSS